jgi:hypothetical protein
MKTVNNTKINEPTPKQTQVESAMFNLSTVCEKFQNVLDVHKDRIKTVLLEESPSTSVIARDKGDLCELASSISDYVYRLNSLVDELHSITERVEL